MPNLAVVSAGLDLRFANAESDRSVASETVRLSVEDQFGGFPGLDGGPARARHVD